MTEEAFNVYVAEKEVAAALGSVRLVFELAFPDQLVAAAERVIETGGRRDTNIVSGAARYPASWVLTMVSKARSYNGNVFWERQDMAVFGRHEPPRLAAVTTSALKSLGLEVFEDIIDAENALRRLTPVLMHAGIPTENVPALLELIAGSARRHRFGAEEQLADWLETTHGLRGLWRAPQLLFKYGGSMAIDLLDRFNEAIAGRAEESGLPAHLLAALEQTEGDLKRRARSVGGLPRPIVLLDPWSGQGPVVRLPAATSDVVSLWRLTGAQTPEVASRRSDTDVVLGPAREWEFSAIRNGLTIGKWGHRPYSEIPVVLFSGRTGRQLKRSGARLVVDSDRVFALVHPKVEAVDATIAANAYPPVYGLWSGWKLHEIDLAGRDSLTFRDTGVDETEERIVLFRESRPPQLLVGGQLAGLRASTGTLLLPSPPVLGIESASAAAQLVRVVLRTEHLTRELTLEELGDGPEYDLSPFWPMGELVGVAVAGPIGLRMPETSVLVLPGLTVEQTPSVALDSDPVTVTATTHSERVSVVVPAATATASLTLDGHLLTAVARRVWWGATAPSQPRVENSSTPFLVTADELRSADAPVFTLSSGAEVWSRIELQDGDRVLMRVDPGAPLPRWSKPLSILADTVAGAGVQSLDVVAVVDGRYIPVGRIISAYRPQISAATIRTEGPEFHLTFDLAEEKPFKNRVARLWLVDRPWEPSLRFPLEDGRSDSFRLPITAPLRSGNYRLAVFVEDPWSPEPDLPRPGEGGAIGFSFTNGRSPDPNEPLDALLEMLARREERVFDVESVRDFGHLLVSLLQQQVRDEGPAGLSGFRASRVLHAFDANPGAIVGSILRAINERAIRPNALPLVSLALLPTVVHHEQELDLHLDDDVADAAWVQVPLLSAAVESWTDGGRSTERWTRHLGWPRAIEAAVGEESEPTINGEAGLPRQVERVPRHYQHVDFDMALARVLDRPEFRDFVFQTGALSDQMLSVDGERLAIVDCIDRVGNDRRLNEWFDRHYATVDRCYHRSRATAHRTRIDSYRVRDQFKTPVHHLLRDISALSAGLLIDRELRYVARDALVDAMEYAPLWVSFCILQAIADDALDHSLAPLNNDSGDH